MERLGSLSARYESAASGEDAVGQDSTGGASYGTYQIATRVGTMRAFLAFCRDRARYAPIDEALRPLVADMTDRRGRFAARWRQLADPTDCGGGMEALLREAEHEFILETHYLPALRSLPDSSRVVVEASPTLQQVLWSMAVQHSPRSVQIGFSHAVRPGRALAATIRDIYKYRATRLGRLTAREREAVLNRYRDECARALLMLARENNQQR